MSSKKYTPADNYTVGPGRVVQQLYKSTGLYLTANRDYSSSYVVKRGVGSAITSESGTGGSFQPCEHTKETYSSRGEADPALCEGHSNNPALTGGVVYSSCTGLARYALGQAAGNLSTIWGSVNPLVDNINWDLMGARAFQAMRPTMSTDFSLLNFLYELKDFKHLARSAINAFKRKQSVIYALLNEIGITSQAFHLSYASGETLKHLSQLYLQYSFAWKPFVSDVVQLIDALTSFDKRWREFIRRAGTPQQRYWATFIAGTESAETVSYDQYIGPPGGSVGFFTPYCRVKIKKVADKGVRYHATMRYKYKLPSDALTAAGACKALLDSLGVRRNPAIIWNAIPYTFLIDWVVNVGKLLDSVSLDNLEVQTEVTEFCHSAKLEKTLVMTASMKREVNGVTYYSPDTEMRTYTKSHYRRAVGFPSSTAVLAVSGLSSSEFSLAAALALSRRS